MPVSRMPEDDDRQFWQVVSEQSLAKIWDNVDDDVYKQLAGPQVDQGRRVT